MRKSRYKSPQKVLVFSGTRRMLARVCSLHAAADIMDMSPMTISQCCNGKSIASGGYYFRYENPDIIVDDNDYGKLNIEEYDLLCGEKRTYKTKVEMNKFKVNSIRRRIEKHGRLIDNSRKNKK